MSDIDSTTWLAKRKHSDDCGAAVGKHALVVFTGTVDFKCDACHKKFMASSSTSLLHVEPMVEPGGSQSSHQDWAQASAAAWAPATNLGPPRHPTQKDPSDRSGEPDANKTYYTLHSNGECRTTFYSTKKCDSKSYKWFPPTGSKFTIEASSIASAISHIAQCTEVVQALVMLKDVG